MTTEVCISQLVAIRLCRNKVLTLHDEEQRNEIHGARAGLRDLKFSSIQCRLYMISVRLGASPPFILAPDLES